MPKAGGKGGGGAGSSMNLLHFFKPSTGPAVREIAVASVAPRHGQQVPLPRKGADGSGGEEEEGREFEDFVTPVKRVRGVDRSRDSAVGGTSASGLDEEAGEEQTPIPGPAPHARCESLTRLGTPAQTYSRRKRQRIGELLESPAQPSRRNPADERAEGAAPSKLLRQSYLDLGQSNFGPTRCPTCGLLYTVGEPTDERTHREFHKKFLSSRRRLQAAETPRAPSSVAVDANEESRQGEEQAC